MSKNVVYRGSVCGLDKGQCWWPATGCCDLSGGDVRKGGEGWAEGVTAGHIVRGVWG